MAPLLNQYKLHFHALLAAALRAVEPAEAVKRSFFPADFAEAKRVFVVAAGKAGAAMTEAAVDILGNRLAAGVATVPIPPRHTCERIAFFTGGHPLPDNDSLAAGRAVADMLAQTTEHDLVLALVSGGGSALMELPQPGLTLADLQSTTDALLRCGATIYEINCIRARLSQLKGGGLARLAYPAGVLGLILSDVVGNAFDTVASGLTVPVSSSPADAEAVIDKYYLRSALPNSVLECLKRQDSHEKSAERSPSPRVENRLIACNRVAGEAAAAAANALGFEGIFLADDWQGEAREAGRRFAQLLIDNAGYGPKCLVAGGETTVIVRGSGKGGRNQEAALAAAIAIAGRPNIALAAFATDGVDGPTDAAGAIVTGDTVDRARLLGLDPRLYLDDNNAYAIFSALGDLVMTGPTGTNVNDLLIGLAYSPHERTSD
jgi:glycerate 2-kinase